MILSVGTLPNDHADPSDPGRLRVPCVTQDTRFHPSCHPGRPRSRVNPRPRNVERTARAAPGSHLATSARGPVCAYVPCLSSAVRPPYGGHAAAVPGRHTNGPRRSSPDHCGKDRRGPNLCLRLFVVPRVSQTRSAPCSRRGPGPPRDSANSRLGSNLQSRPISALP